MGRNKSKLHDDKALEQIKMYPGLVLESPTNLRMIIGTALIVSSKSCEHLARPDLFFARVDRRSCTRHAF